jgi:hypothetical protein
METLLILQIAEKIVFTKVKEELGFGQTKRFLRNI